MNETQPEAVSASTSIEKGLVGKFVENLLIGTVEAIARAGAKAVESLAGDASKAVEIQRRKIEVVAQGVKSWREMNVGEIDVNGDLPSDLK